MGVEKIKATRPEVDVVSTFKKCDLFADVPEFVLKQIAERCRVIFLSAGDPLFVENELSSNVYVVASGIVEIVRYKNLLRQAASIRTFKEGEHFSEFSVLAGSNHSTSCFAHEESLVVSIPSELFLEFLKKFPSHSNRLAFQLAKQD